jgi:hypothetical protein
MFYIKLAQKQDFVGKFAIFTLTYLSLLFWNVVWALVS